MWKQKQVRQKRDTNPILRGSKVPCLKPSNPMLDPKNQTKNNPRIRSAAPRPEAYFNNPSFGRGTAGDCRDNWESGCTQSFFEPRPRGLAIYGRPHGALLVTSLTYYGKHASRQTGKQQALPGLAWPELTTCIGTYFTILILMGNMRAGRQANSRLGLA